MLIVIFARDNPVLLVMPFFAALAGWVYYRNHIEPGRRRIAELETVLAEVVRLEKSTLTQRKTIANSVQEQIKSVRLDIKQVRNLVHTAIDDLSASFAGLHAQSLAPKEFVVSLVRNLSNSDAVKADGENNMSIIQFASETERILQFFVDTVTSTSKESMRLVFQLDDMWVQANSVVKLLTRSQVNRRSNEPDRIERGHRSRARFRRGCQ